MSTPKNTRWSGSEVEFNPGQRADPNRLKPTHPGEHVWVALASFRLTPESLRRREAEGLNLDAENLARVDVACLECEQPWSDRLSWRVCRGRPGDAP